MNIIRMQKVQLSTRIAYKLLKCIRNLTLVTVVVACRSCRHWFMVYAVYGKK